jgi:hypothetical protein
MGHAEFPIWLQGLATASVCLAFACALAIGADEARRRQRMWIMNLVWPLTVLFGSALCLGFYWRSGRGPRPDEHRRDPTGAGETPMAVAVAKGASHCAPAARWVT